ncbi:hypothetical protein Tco_1080107 [Tanacetum coccineum]|uniref:Uncharacterized protein n=1 Tax=Tanacetum coccineum TaxID=301880 RepID=A0ABQ5HTS3_9ASTR
MDNRSNADMHSEGQDSPLTKLINVVDGKFKFRMVIPETMMIDAIKPSVGYKYYKHKKDESEKDKATEEPKEQHVSLVRSGRGKGYMCSETIAIELAKLVSIKEQRLQQRKIMTKLTIERQVEKDVEDTYDAETRLKLKGVVIKDPAIQSLLDLQKGSKESRLETTDGDATRDSSCSDTNEEKDDESDDFDDLNMVLSDDESNKRDDDVTGFGNLLNEPLVQELTDLMCKPVYIDAHTTFEVANLEGNPEEMFPDDAAHHISSPPATTTHDLITFKKAAEQKFKEYDQKLEALSSINVPETIKEVVQAKVLTEMKKQLPTYVPTTISKFVKPRLNNYVHEVMKNNQISLFTTPSQTTTDDLSKMELKLNLLNKMYQNKSNETYDTYQKLYNTLYESITLDQEALDAQDTEPSSNKRTHDDQDPPNNREGETRHKRRKDASEPLSRSSKKYKAHVKRPNTGWFNKKSGSAEAAKRKMAWFDMLLKYDINQNEDHILGPSTVDMAKKLKALIKKDELTITALEGDVSKPRSFKKHMSKSTKPHNCFYNNDFYYLLSTGEKYATSLTKHFAARRSDKKKYEFSYADLPRLSLNDIEDMYLLKVQDKLHHLQSDFEKDFNNAFLLFIKRIMIQNRKIPHTMLGTEKGIAYLNQHNIKSLMKLGEGRDWSNKDIKRSNEMLEKIDKTLKHKEQLRRLEEYVGGRPKTFDPHLFVRL